uniref:Uncharacterized protein n=1 Tax=Aegilops tauschii subsp. strangulata TaxID=200361 RepID=A0A452XT46_AEGTS
FNMKFINGDLAPKTILATAALSTQPCSYLSIYTCFSRLLGRPSSKLAHSSVPSLAREKRDGSPLPPAPPLRLVLPAPHRPFGCSSVPREESREDSDPDRPVPGRGLTAGGEDQDLSALR